MNAPLGELAAWMAATMPARAMRENAWLYPLVETAHILGVVLLVGGVAMFDLRLLGFGHWLAPRALARHLLPWSVGGFLLAAPSGVLLFSTQPAEMLANPVFLLKMGLVAAAALNAAAFHAGSWWRTAGAGDAAPPGVRLHGALSLLFWVGAIACGRMLAYV